MLWLLIALPLVAGSCTAPAVPVRLGGEGAEQQVPAIVAATAAGRDRSEVAALVRKLDHRDPAVRAFAGEALYRISGQRFGYRYYQNASDRRSAVATYERWLTQDMPGPAAFDAASDAKASLDSVPQTGAVIDPAIDRTTAPTKDPL